MAKLYSYVGPEEIFEAIDTAHRGLVIASSTTLERWLHERSHELDHDDCLTATFVIDEDGALLIADRHSEHVACAGGRDVLAAGEIVFCAETPPHVVGVSNLSTGYCPEPACWPAIKAALEALDIQHPDALSASFIFRRCEACGQRCVVKEGWFECAVCGNPLPDHWNFIRA